MPRHPQVYLRLWSIPWWQSHLMVVQASEHSFPLQCWSRMSCCYQRSHQGILVVSTPNRVAITSMSRHCGLLWQHQHDLHVLQPNSASAHQEYRDWSSLRAGKSCLRWCSHTAHPNIFIVRQHIHQGSFVFSIFTEFRISLNARSTNDKTAWAC